MSNFCLPPYTLHEVGNIETLSDSYQWGLINLNVPEIWKDTQGEGIRVMILDTGITRHPDLINNLDLSAAKSFIDGEDEIDIGCYHGVHVSGIVGASSNGFGVVGVAPKVTIIPVKVLNKNGMSSGDSVLNGLKYALEISPDIVNMSLGTYSPMDAEKNIISQLVSRGIVVICAAGNFAEKGVMFPAAFSDCIAVGAYGPSISRDRASFSAIGPELDYLAPGQEILSTFGDNTYSIMSGSSMAAPFLTGVVALLLSKYKKLGQILSVNQIKDLLKKNVIDAPVNGFNSERGFGIVDPRSLIFTQQNINNTVIPKKTFWQRLFFWRK